MNHKISKGKQGVIGFVAIMALISVTMLWKHNSLLFILLSILSVNLLLIDKSIAEIKTFIFCALFGALSESLVIRGGHAREYHNPDIINIPLWLFLLRGIAGVFMSKIHGFFMN